MVKSFFIFLITLSTICHAQTSPLTVVASEAQRVKGIDQLIQIENEVYLRKAQQGIDLETVGLIRVQTEAENVSIEVEDIKRDPVPFEKINDEYYRISQSGKFWIEVTAIDFTKNLYGKENRVLVVGQSPTPPPTPPIPPEPPTPPPTPPTPDAPIAAEGMHILVVYESAPTEAEQMTPAQANMLNATSTRSYLSSIASDNWRILDKDTSYTDADNVWGKALKRPRASIPWIIISNGKTGYEGPLPKTFDDLKALIVPLVPSTGRT